MIKLDHPDDVTARVDLRKQLRDLRINLGLSGEATARLAGFHYPAAVRSLEAKTSWELWRVQQWARGLEHTVRLEIDGVDVPDDDMTTMVLRATTAFGGFDEDQLHRQIVARDLLRARTALMSRAEMARRLGLNDRAVSCWENEPLQSLLRVYQRYARALGGRVVPRLEPVTAEVPA